MIVVLLPSYNPPHVPLYQIQSEPTPKVPPDSNKEEDKPSQITEGVPIADVAGVETVFIVIFALIQLVV